MCFAVQHSGADGLGDFMMDLEVALDVFLSSYLQQGWEMFLCCDFKCGYTVYFFPGLDFGCLVLGIFVTSLTGSLYCFMIGSLAYWQIWIQTHGLCQFFWLTLKVAAVMQQFFAFLQTQTVPNPNGGQPVPSPQLSRPGPFRAPLRFSLRRWRPGVC